MHPTINFNNDTLNIFTDASIRKEKYGFTSSSMQLTVNGNNQTTENIIFRDSTNNYGELYAIYLGALSAYAYTRNSSYQAINLFSDSLISINTLRSWIFGWIIDKDGILYAKTRKKVMNQSIICDILSVITTFEIPINFYHINGHFKPNKLEEFKSNIYMHNNVKYEIDDDTALSLMKYNDFVDKLSRNMLSDPTVIVYDKPIIERSFNTNLDLRKYKDLIIPKY